MAERPARVKKVLSFLKSEDLAVTLREPEALKDIRVENCIGFSQVPIGLAGPLHLTGPDNIDNLFMDTIFAPLATYKPTLVASYSRGYKAFNASGRLNFEVLRDRISRAPVFVFDHPGYAADFARAIPAFQGRFAKWAELTSEHVQLRSMKPKVIGSQVHLFCIYHCGSATGQNMVTKATKYACDRLREELEIKFFIRDFLIEGQLVSNKMPSWGNVKELRGVEVIVWGTITIFIATGQDVGSVAEASWSHLISEVDGETKDMRLTLYFPSLPVGSVGGGTGYTTQQEALKLVKYAAPDMKGHLAGIIASFALTLDASTSAAVANDTFTESHMRLDRGQRLEKI